MAGMLMILTITIESSSKITKHQYLYFHTVRSQFWPTAAKSIKTHQEGLDSKCLQWNVWQCVSVTSMSQREASYDRCRDESRKGRSEPRWWVVQEQFVLITGYNGQRLARDGATHAHRHHAIRSGSGEHEQNQNEDRSYVKEITQLSHLTDSDLTRQFESLPSYSHGLITQDRHRSI